MPCSLITTTCPSSPPTSSSSTWKATANRVTLDGEAVDLATGPVVWGTPGTNGQHAYYQLLHQGTRLVPADFIGFLHPAHRVGDHHDLLMANFFAQTEALGVRQDGQRRRGQRGSRRRLVPHRTFPGNRPTNTILAPELSPRVLGELVASLRAQGPDPGSGLGHQ